MRFQTFHNAGAGNSRMDEDEQINQMNQMDREDGEHLDYLTNDDTFEGVI